jgi:hypothetical protein
MVHLKRGRPRKERSVDMAREVRIKSAVQIPDGVNRLRRKIRKVTSDMYPYVKDPKNLVEDSSGGIDDRSVVDLGKVMEYGSEIIDFFLRVNLPHDVMMSDMPQELLVIMAIEGVLEFGRVVDVYRDLRIENDPVQNVINELMAVNVTKLCAIVLDYVELFKKVNDA